MKAFVFDEIRSTRVKALLELKDYQEGEPILGMLVQIKNGDKTVIGRVIDAYRTSDVINDIMRVKNISVKKDSPMTQMVINEREGIVLVIDLITAFQNNWRVPLTFLLKPLSEVHFLEELPIPSISHAGYLGKLWGSEIKVPLVLKDFQALKEAYHFFIAGQTGSGKSTLTQMLLALYNKLNPNMNFLILDTVGEFTASFKGNGKIFLPLKDVWKGAVEIYTPPKDLTLEGWDIFAEVCKDYGVMKEIGVPMKSEENTNDGIDAIINLLKKAIYNMFRKNMVKQNANTSTKYLSPSIIEDAFSPLLENDSELDEFVGKIYKRDKDAKDRVKDKIRNPVTFKSFIEKIKEIAKLFCTDNDNKKTISDIINDFSTSVVNGKPGKCVVLNFTFEQTRIRAGDLRTKYVRETLRSLYSAGIDIYNNIDDVNLNTLVILEEAHKYAPKYTDKEEVKRLSDEIVQYYIETRKFGIGWACITTRPSNVRREIVEHSRVKIIGMGLTSGPDADFLRETFGQEFLELYRLLPDPYDQFAQRKEVTFAIHGPITTLSRQTPEFITVFNTKEEFLESNR